MLLMIKQFASGTGSHELVSGKFFQTSVLQRSMMIAEEEFWMDFESSDLTFKMFVGV